MPKLENGHYPIYWFVVICVTRVRKVELMKKTAQRQSWMSRTNERGLRKHSWIEGWMKLTESWKKKNVPIWQIADDLK